MAEPKKKKKPTLRKAPKAIEPDKAPKAIEPDKADEQARPSSKEEGAPSVEPASAPKETPSPFVSGDEAYGKDAMAKREEADRAAKKAEKRKAKAEKRKAKAEAKRAQKSEKTPQKAPRPKVKVSYSPKQILTFVILVLLAALVIVVAAFSWNRWLRYDDAADFLGVWNYADGAVQVTIDGEEIELTKDAVFAYELDTFNKSITFTVGDFSGHGVYEFSEDRNVLLIVDGRSPDLASILGLANIAEGVASDSVTKLVRAGELPSEEPASSSQAASSGTPSSQDGSDGQASGKDSDDSAEGSLPDDSASQSADSSSESSSDGTQDAGGSQGGTGQSVDSLGSDPGAGAGSNVVTPEDIGVSPDSLSSE